MTTPNPVSLTIDPKTVESIIHANIQAAIVAQFASYPEFLNRLVGEVLGKKVNEEGKVDSYSSYNRHPLVEVLAGNAIKTATEAAVKEWVNEHRLDILTAVKKHLNASKNDLVKSFVKAADDSLKTSFRVNCDIKFSG